MLTLRKPPLRSGWRLHTLLAGSGISKLGDHLYYLAIPWLAYEVTHSAVIMGSLYTIQMLPQFLFSGIAGVAVDRLNRWRLLLFSDIGRAVLVALLPLMYMADLLRVWHFFSPASCYLA